MARKKPGAMQSPNTCPSLGAVVLRLLTMLAPAQRGALELPTAYAVPLAEAAPIVPQQEPELPRHR